MYSGDAVTLLSVGGPAPSLVVRVRRETAIRALGDPWFGDPHYQAEIVVDAPPFAGTLLAVLTLADLRVWAASMDTLGSPPGQVVLGGGRTVLLVLTFHEADGTDRLAIEVEVTPSEDDPYPFLRYMIWGVGHFWHESRRLIADMAEAEERVAQETLDRRARLIADLRASRGRHGTPPPA